MFLLSPACFLHILMQQQYDYVFILYETIDVCFFFIAELKPTLQLSDLESHHSWSSFLKRIVQTKKMTCLMSFQTYTTCVYL